MILAIHKTVKNGMLHFVFLLLKGLPGKPGNSGEEGRKVREFIQNRPTNSMNISSLF